MLIQLFCSQFLSANNISIPIFNIEKWLPLVDTVAIFFSSLSNPLKPVGLFHFLIKTRSRLESCTTPIFILRNNSYSYSLTRQLVIITNCCCHIASDHSFFFSLSLLRTSVFYRWRIFPGNITYLPWNVTFPWTRPFRFPPRRFF